MRCPWRNFVVVALAAILLASCGGAGDGAPSHLEIKNSALEGNVTLSDGRSFDLASFRGRPVVVILFATADSASEVQMPEAEKAFKRLGGLVGFIGLAMDANDASLLPAYADFIRVDFPLGIAPEAVMKGESPLGRVAVVPSVVILDVEGKVHRVLSGTTSADDIDQGVSEIQGPLVPPPGG